jgi:predicted GNAT family acetyltransferase
MFHVAKMKTSDFLFAVQLANTMDWNMTVKDFEFNVKLEPQGCFIQFQHDERVGIATTISFGKVGWFGNFIVKKTIRGEGAGSFLMQKAIAYLKSNDVETIGLYAYPHLVKFYEHFGFKSDINFSVLKGKPTFPIAQNSVKAATKLNIPELVELDRRCFGASRKKLLEPLFFNKNNLCYISTENHEITGYVVAKVYSKMAEVGPLISPAKRVEGALMLLKAILNRLSGFEVFMYIPQKEIELLNLLRTVGFKEEFSLVRMFLGPVIIKNCIYAAESLERG